MDVVLLVKLNPTEALMDLALAPPVAVAVLLAVSAREILRVPGPFPSTRQLEELGHVVELERLLTLVMRGIPGLQGTPPP